MSYHTVDLYQLTNLPVDRFGAICFLTDTFPGMPMSTIGSHFVPYAREFPFDLAFQPVGGQGVTYSFV